MDNQLLLEYLVWWFGFGAIHSMMALQKFKSVFPMKGQNYRILYNIISIITFLIVLLNVPSLATIVEKGFELSLIQFIVFITIAILGSVLIFLGINAWNLSSLAGIKPENCKLQTHGIFAFSRHPVYSGFMLLLVNLMIIGIDIAIISWVLGCGGYFLVGSFLEERNLTHHLEEYKDYKINVARFLPYKKDHFQYLSRNFRSGPNID